jgi:alpha-1,4-digalacturonate transport system substrate-binding protein
MPGGSGLIAIKTAKDPKAVGRVMDYLASEDVLREFYSRALFVPGHLGLSAKGVDYPTASPPAREALKVFAKGVGSVAPLAYRLQGYPYNRLVFNAVISRLGQAVSGEISLDDAYKRIDSDIAQQLAERKK